MKNLSNGEMVQIAEEKKNKTPRYIDANKLIDLATHEGAYGYVDVHDIYNIPPADVVERKKGKWYVRDITRYGGKPYICTVCGRGANDVYHFCPSCGADMREEKN